MALTIQNKTNINIEDINVQVTCRECSSRYNVKMDRPIKGKNCRCGKGTFMFMVKSYPGKVVVSVAFTGYDGVARTIEPDGYSIGD